MDIVDQCSIVLLISVFGCHTNAFILKCTYNAADASVSSQSSPLFLPHHHHHHHHHPTIPASLLLSSSPSHTHSTPLLHFFPWSEFRSATALTHTHDETEWDTIWLRLTHTLGIEVFCVRMCTRSRPPTYDDDAADDDDARTHIIVGIWFPPPPSLLPSSLPPSQHPLFTNHGSSPRSLGVPGDSISARRAGVRLHI